MCTPKYSTVHVGTREPRSPAGRNADRDGPGYRMAVWAPGYRMAVTAPGYQISVWPWVGVESAIRLKSASTSVHCVSTGWISLPSAKCPVVCRCALIDAIDFQEDTCPPCAFRGMVIGPQTGGIVLSGVHFFPLGVGPRGPGPTTSTVSHWMINT